MAQKEIYFEDMVKEVQAVTTKKHTPGKKVKPQLTQIDQEIIVQLKASDAESPLDIATENTILHMVKTHGALFFSDSEYEWEKMFVNRFTKELQKLDGFETYRMEHFQDSTICRLIEKARFFWIRHIKKCGESADGHNEFYYDFDMILEDDSYIPMVALNGEKYYLKKEQVDRMGYIPANIRAKEILNRPLVNRTAGLQRYQAILDAMQLPC